jgi:hypothetical protein
MIEGWRDGAGEGSGMGSGQSDPRWISGIIAQRGILFPFVPCLDFYKVLQFDKERVLY